LSAANDIFDTSDSSSKLTARHRTKLYELQPGSMKRARVSDLT